MPQPRPLTDAELEALLRTLPREAPSVGFADRVMARVRLPGTGPIRHPIRWRTLVGLAALDLAVAAGLLVWFGDALLHGVGDLLRQSAKLVAGIGSIDPGAVLRDFVYDLIRGAGTVLPGEGALATTLLVGAAGSLLTIASLDRLARSAASSSR